MKNNKFLIAIDSDGTLRHSDGTISEYSKEVINKVVSNGNIVVLCTARPRYYALKICSEVGINNYFISSNGAEVYDNIKGDIIYSKYISSSLCKELYFSASKHNVRIIFVTEENEYATLFTRNDSQILLDDSNLEECINKDIKQIMFLSTNTKHLDKLKKLVDSNKDLTINNYSSKNKVEQWFSVTCSGLSKGKALEELSKYLDIPIENTIAIGNDINDISMFKSAGVSVAVANADDEIKKYVDFVTLSNDEDGVAAYLIRYI